jgi:hypothetical protein
MNCLHRVAVRREPAGDCHYICAVYNFRISRKMGCARWEASGDGRQKRQPAALSIGGITTQKIKY